jgi:para-aminobenzoate synthetase component 1
MSGPVSIERLTGRVDPWETCQRLAGLPHVLFLDSALRHPQLGRYSFLAADPRYWFSWSPGRGSAQPWATLAELVAALPRVEPRPEWPPFLGGLAGLWSYDLNATLERVPPPRVDEFGLPHLAVGVYDWVLAWDHHTNQSWLISTGWHPGQPLSSRQARARAEQVHGWLERGVPRRHDAATPSVTLAGCEPCPTLPGVQSNFSRAAYLAALERALGYIHAGDCFQVNLSQRLTAPSQPPLPLYGRLRSCNAATFAGYFDLGEFQLLCSSPERFLRVTPSGLVETRPIKGTRGRASNALEDAAVVADLRASPKDHAENVMIVDLLRNDLGRVCAYGSVQVAELCAVESYAAVHHLVSVVTGRLRPKLGPLDLLRACFPGGSVTGAPKIRAMEIIAELEPTARGAYCGSLGYLSFTGAMDANILIRTFTHGLGWLQFPVGGGIVADSDPAAEYAETLHKAAGLVRALTP